MKLGPSRGNSRYKPSSTLKAVGVAFTIAMFSFWSVPKFPQVKWSYHVCNTRGRATTDRPDDAPKRIKREA